MSQLREARSAVGWTQAELASAAGLSRQTVGAVEAGHNRPSVDAALALAAALGCSVEDLFAAPAGVSKSVLAQTASEGEAVLAARVGSRLVHAPARCALAFEGWPVANAVLRGGRPTPLPGADLQGYVIVGCDPALGLASAMLPQAGPRHVIALSGSTGVAIDAMRAGRAHGALVHNEPDRLPKPPHGVLRLHLARWRVGLASRGRRGCSLEELCDGGARVVQRDDGASSQKAFVAAATARAGVVPDGPRAAGHLEVVRSVADGAAAGVTMEPAALNVGLAFEPLEEHVSELWLDARWREHPAVETFASLLRSSAFTQRLALVGGYQTAGCGSQQDDLS
jgi:DNA-binding XRE family transcriptional regulator